MMETKIKEVHDYFKNKIINGDYKVTQKSTHYWSVSIDGTYNFSLWVANKAYGFETYSSSFAASFMTIFFNEMERKKAFDFIEGLINEYDKSFLKAQRKKEFENLKKEFEPTK